MGRAGRPPPPKPKADVHLVVNLRRNSVLAQAPADKMAIIQQAVKALDVDAGEGPASLLANVTRARIYRLASIDPEPLVKTLEEIGNLDPHTRLQVDRPNRAIIAYAPLADQVTIRALVDKLDGTGRKFEVLQLRRLAADYVAGSVAFMMTGAKEKPQQQRRPYWFDGGPTLSEPQEKPNEFRCDADVRAQPPAAVGQRRRDRRGAEAANQAGRDSARRRKPFHRANAGRAGGQGDRRMAGAVRRVWPSLAPNPLTVPPPEAPADRPPRAAADKAPPDKAPAHPPPTDSKQTDARQRTPAAGPPTALAIWTVAAADEAPAVPGPAAVRRPSAAPPAATRSAATPSSAVDAAANSSAPRPPGDPDTRSPDGRLIVTSPDTKALDLLEDVMARLEPPRTDGLRDHRLKYAWATGLATALPRFLSGGRKRQAAPQSLVLGFRLPAGNRDQVARAALASPAAEDHLRQRKQLDPGARG